tara:strand:- start:184 stop:354 length:171 start_codon:yes stop_codon:yes gene_type:complete
MKTITSVKKMEYNGQVICYVMVANGVTQNVPIDPENTEYQEILEWVKDGNTIEEAD